MNHTDSQGKRPQFKTLAMGELPAWPVYAEDEIKIVEDILRSGKVNYWTGEKGKAFEAAMAAHCGVPHGVAVANGSLALELALLALGVGPADDVLVSPRSFIASASSIIRCGATPVFADVDRNSQVVTVESLAQSLTSSTRAIVVVHLAGWPCDMPAIMEFAKKNGLKVIEDCAQAHGATYNGRQVGGFGDVGVFSFCQDKIMSTGGEGGMLVTRHRDIWKRAWSIKDHGKNYNAACGDDSGASPGFRWLHEQIGSNFRLTEIQAAIGLAQLTKLPKWLRQRRANAGILASRLGDCPALRIPLPKQHEGHAFYKFYTFVRSGHLKDGWDRDRVLVEMRKRNIPCYSGSCSEIYMEQSFQEAKYQPASRLPIAKELGETSLMFPVHPTLKQAHMLQLASNALQVLNEASR